jgi:hypothetical protein
MHTFCQIDGTEPRRERAHQITRDLRRAAGHPLRQRTLIGAIVFTPLNGGNAITLDQVKQRVAALLTQDLADQGTELVDVFAQRKVLGGELNLISVHDGDDSTRRSAHNGILTQ